MSDNSGSRRWPGNRTVGCRVAAGDWRENSQASDWVGRVRRRCAAARLKRACSTLR